MPILAIVGNPPYSNFGRMNRGKWILGLLKDYKQGLKEKKINLDDDFIKFIRFAQWKLNQTGQGVFAMITSNTFIDGITHRQMRRSLMDTFDEIYIYDLRGNSRKGEVAPDGSKDENVFNIQQGVSINIFVKYPNKQAETVVRYAELWGSRQEKFAALLDEKFTDTKWRDVNVEGLNQSLRQTLWGKDFGSDLNFFVEKEAKVMLEYANFWGVNKMFQSYNSGVQTKRDSIAVQFDSESLKQVQQDFTSMSTEQLRNKYRLPEDGRDWTIAAAKKDLQLNNPKITDMYYRPFDIRKTLFTGKSKGFLAYPRTEIMRQLMSDNLGLNFTRINRGLSNGYFIVSKNIVDLHPLDTAQDSSMVAPLYDYSSSDQHTLLAKPNRAPNLSPKFTDFCSIKLGLSYISDGRGDLAKTFGPEDLFYYSYAIFYSPSYRSRYAEQLKIDFPRLPVTSDKALFATLVDLGNELVNLHLLGGNPFDKSKTIFDEPNKWSVRVGGEQPEGVDDWKVTAIRYSEKEQRIYVNASQYFEGVPKEVWEFMIGGYQVCDKWLKDRKKASRCLSTDDLKHYIKIIVSLRETIRIMKEVDATIPKWPLE